MYCDKEETANGDIYINDNIYEQRIEMISAPKIQFVMDVFHKLQLKVDSWLDIGCGGGDILWWLDHNYNIRTEGIESDKYEYQFAVSKGLSVSNLYIDLNICNPQIDSIIHRNDVISFFNVLEHIEDPVKSIDYIFNCMHKGAIMVFEVPRHPSVASFANLTCKDGAYRHIVPPIHLQIFTMKVFDFHSMDGHAARPTAG